MLFVNKLKVLTLMTCLVLVGQGFALDCATGTGWGDFLTQEASKPNGKTYYEIDTPEKLAWFACKVTNKSLSTEEFKLTKSLDMQGKLFIPIGSGTGEDTGFKGTFDGQGFTISNLYVNTSEINSDISGITGKSKNGVTAYAQNIGLFGILSNNATVKNLILKDVQIYAAASSGTTGLGSDKPISVGSLVGWVGATDKTVVKIENIVASGFIETSGATNRVGGIAGNVKHVTISNCVSSVSVTASGANTNVGGVVGAIRNDGNVTLTSCAYSGDHLYTVDGSIGAVAGSYENSKGTLTTENLYYSDDFCQEFENPDVCPGIGKLPNGKTFNTEKTENLNSEDIVCELNGGTWNEENKICEGDTSEVWSIGQSSLSMNGSDGYKITFNANGGVFASGAKTSKILSKNATITADEIGVPTREGKKFAGWATKADTTEPNPNLGVARAATVIYAVWYDYYPAIFESNPDTHAADTVWVPKYGTVAVEGFAVPDIYLIPDPENQDHTIKYYFTGWGNSSKMLEEDVDPTNQDTLHLADIEVTDTVRLYAVWTKAKTFSVTFDATLHGKTDVRLVKIVNEGDPVSEPNPNDIISDAGYKVAGWCEVENCTEENEYDFSRSLEGNLTLYARWNIIQFNIEYVLFNGTNGNNPSSYTIEDADIVLADPTKTGSVFEGWFYDDAFTNPANRIDAGSTGDKTIYAKWKQITYTIQYLSGNTIYATAKNDTKNYGETIQLKGALEEYAHGGCNQDGWSRVDYGQDGYGVDYELEADYEDNANLKLFPHWTCNTYTISYEIFGASATNRNPPQYTGPAKLTLENAFDPAKKYFMDDWYKEPTFKTAIRDVQNIDADLTVYARWYNKIIYNPGSRLKAVNSKLGSTTDKKFWDKTHTIRSSIKDFVLANYTLDGWSTTDNGEKVYGLGDAYTTNANLTLYPHWTANTHTITYNNVETSELPEGYPETYTHEASVTLPVPTRNGYEFLGWFVDGEFNGDAVTEIPEGQTEDKVFFAKWSDAVEYTITYENVNGAANENATSYTIEQSVVLNNLEKDGFVFAGWFDNAQFEGDAATEIPQGTTGEKTFYAKWLEIFTITYAAGEGDGITGAVAAGTKTEGEDATLSNDGFTREGYTQTGWKTEDGSVTYAMGATYTTDASVTLYPVWNVETYTITYHNIEGASFETSNPTTYTVEDLPVTLNNPAKVGYTFEGWFTDESFTGNPITGIETRLSNGNGDLYAKWSDPIEYAITYVGADDLENLNPTSYTVLENDLALLPVAKSGFKFLGWFNASDELVESISAGSTGDITLTAKWAGFPITVATYGGVTILENEDGTRTAAIDASSMETVEIAEDVSVDNVTFDRAFTVGATSTIMLPFSIATSKVSGGKFYEFADLQKNEETGRWAASVKPPEQSELQANKPYLFIPEETSIVFNLGGEPVSLNTSVMNPSTSGNWSFKGVYEKTVFTEEHPELGKAYGFAAENKDGFKLGQFVKFGSGAWLRPFRAYLAYNESGALAKSTRSVRASLVNGELPETIDVEIQDGTTRVIGGGTLNTRTGEIKMDRWYDMNGRRLNSKPTTRGTYYYNGKRIVVR